jgi:hypothetical protein
MKANEFLVEALVKKYDSEKLAINKAMTLLNSKCSAAAGLLPNPIWRGMHNHTQEIFFADPSTGVRQSENTSNYYTLLLDSSPHMEGWPKRSSSFICSSNRYYASDYAYGGGGGLFTIFPFNGVKIAVCPDKDMWKTTVIIPEFGMQFIDHLPEMNEWLARLGIEATAKGLQQAHTKPKVIELCRQYNVDPKNFIPIIQTALSPKRTGFKLLTVEQFVASNFRSRECWIGGPVVAIRKDLYEQFLDAYNKRLS